MRLTRLEIYGFKSFARRTEIVFPQNVTGIVGPNGSGKSNIADAVRWVLGEQSARTLRGNSMQDVIFNGTQQRKPLRFCEVTLVFDNGDGALPVAYGEVSITRRVFRNGDSEYLMNGSACRLKDIVDLFRDTGVGKEGYSIIGQGRIDEILSQRGEDRRAVFEEAAGISRYRSRKEEAESRLKKAEENLARVDDVLGELQTHLEPLEKQAETAKEYLLLADSLKKLDLRLYLLREERLSGKEAEADRVLLQLSDAVKEAEASLDAGEESRRALEEEEAALQAALSAAHEAQLEKNDVLYAAREAMAEIKNRAENAAEAGTRLEAEKETALNRLRLVEATLNRSDGGMSEADRLCEEASVAADEAKAGQEAAGKAVEELEEELSEHNARVMDRLNRVQTSRTAQARHVAMQQVMEKRRAEITAQIAEEEKKGSSLKEAVESAENSLREEEKRLEEYQAQARQAEESAMRLQAEETQAAGKLHEIQQNLREAETRLRTLKELQEGYEGYQYPVKSALNYAKKSGMKGVHNVLAMLLHVPREYETALDMALGAGMQNIVTDTEREAQTLIEYLRKNRLGRATFLPLSTVRGRTLTPQERQVLSMEGCLGVASELCSFEEKYRGIVESLLGRTVVAKDLNSGIAIMRRAGHSFRLVTMDGDLMHQGGSMTGGSVQQKAQNLLGREREVRELAEKAAALAVEVHACEETLARLAEEKNQDSERRQTALYTLHQQEIAVARDTEHLKAARNEADTHAARMESLEGAISQIDESLAEITAELRRMEQAQAAEEEDADSLSERTKVLSAQVDKARRAREVAAEKLTDALLTLQNARHDADVIRRDRTRLTADRESCRKELARLDEKIVENRAAREEALKGTEKAEAAILDREAEAAAAKEEVARAEKAVADKQAALRELQTEMELTRREAQRAAERQHRQELTLNRLKTDLTALNERLWNTYELTRLGAEEALAAEEANDTDWRSGFDEKRADEEALSLRERIRAMGTVNVAAIEEYAQSYERFTQLNTQRQDLEQAKADLRSLIADLLEKMEGVFTSRFSELQGYFSDTFARLFGGGSGEILLADDTDPLNCGIEIIVQPPGKKRQLLSLFSGGERALTAIAILFAMLKLKPTPFCILDEIEAALDDANIYAFADYLKEFSADTQFVVITHRKGTMERCDTLFGVAMEEKGVSSLVSVNLTDYE